MNVKQCVPGAIPARVPRPVLGARRTWARSPTHLCSAMNSGGHATAPKVVTHTDRLLLVVGVALIQRGCKADARESRVLLAQRPPGKANQGLWEFPGGKVDPGETPEGALVRELKEELGLQVEPEDLVPLSFVSFPYPTFHLLMPLYACYQWKGEPHGAEGQAIVFANKLDLQQHQLTPADVPLQPAVIQALEAACD